MEQMRKLPIGIQTFEKLREEDYLYVDKTAMVYQIVASSIPYFLSRPRRFGKSLLLPRAKRTVPWACHRKAGDGVGAISCASSRPERPEI